MADAEVFREALELNDLRDSKVEELRQAQGAAEDTLGEYTSEILSSSFDSKRHSAKWRRPPSPHPKMRWPDKLCRQGVMVKAFQLAGIENRCCFQLLGSFLKNLVIVPQLVDTASIREHAVLFVFLLRHLLKTRWALKVVWQSVEELQEAALETQTFLADASCCGQALREDPSKADVAKDLRTLRDDLELLKEWQKELQIRKQKVQQAPGASARPTQIVQNRRGVAEGGTT